MQSPDSGALDADGSNSIRHGPLVLNYEGFSVTLDGNDLPLTLGEFLLLAELARNPYSVLDRQRLASVLRANNGSADGGEASLRAVDVHISRLRRKLHAAGYDCIKTMRFVGYRFVPA